MGGYRHLARALITNCFHNFFSGIKYDDRIKTRASVYEAFFFGTLAPFLRASERPMAIACLRLLTGPPFPPLPDRSVPFFSRRTALSTDLPAAWSYLRPPDFRELLFFLAAIFISSRAFWIN